MVRASELLRKLTALRPFSEGGEAGPRVLLVAAHPDDDVIGAGNRLALLAQRASVAYVSDGAPKNERFCADAGFCSRGEYACARRQEARRALALCGIGASATHELGGVDQEVALSLSPLLDALLDLLDRVQPELVLTHAYEGGHPDHDATALLVHAGCELLRRKGKSAPALAEFASYHERDGSLAFGEFLPHDGHPELTVELAGEALEHKLALLRCHETQRGIWRLFPPNVERYRSAPSYDFCRAPAAPFFYDRVDWGLRGEDFLVSSRALLATLGIEGSC